MIQLVDDQLLGEILRGAAPPEPGSETYTTGYWYVRLCQAVLSASERSGVLSTPFQALPAASRTRAVRAVLELPETVGLLSLRDLAPLIGHLRGRHNLNMLAMEALAAAVHLDARVVLSAPSPRLEDALRAEGRTAMVLR